MTLLHYVPEDAHTPPPFNWVLLLFAASATEPFALSKQHSSGRLGCSAPLCGSRFTWTRIDLSTADVIYCLLSFFQNLSCHLYFSVHGEYRVKRCCWIGPGGGERAFQPSFASIHLLAHNPSDRDILQEPFVAACNSKKKNTPGWSTDIHKAAWYWSYRKRIFCGSGLSFNLAGNSCSSCHNQILHWESGRWSSFRCGAIS